MAEYIERDNYCKNICKCNAQECNKSVCPIWQAPAVDAVPVVRCKDCIHDGLLTCPLCYIEHRTMQFINHDENFYCGFGERKDGDEE